MQRITSIRSGYLWWLAAAPLFLLCAPIESWSEESRTASAPAAEPLRLSGAEPLDLEEVLRAFSRVMEVPILWDPDDDRIAGRRVVLGHTLSVTRSQLVPALGYVLQVHALKADPVAAEGLAVLRVVALASRAGHITAYVPLLDADVSYVAPLLQSQFQDSHSPVRITSDARTNTLIIRADPLTMKHVRKAQQHLDLHIDHHVPVAACHTLRPEHVAPADLLRAIRPHLRAETTSVYAAGARSAPAPICSLGPRGQVLVCTATERQWDQIKALVLVLDAPAAPEGALGAGRDR